VGGRVLCLAFDSPDLGLVQRGIDEGWLPTLGRLVEGGRFVPLDDLQDLLTSSTWPTLVTGTDLPEHLVVSDRQLVPGSYRVVPVRAEDARRPPFWRYVSDAGLRSTIVSVYGAPLTPGLLGTQVVGWGTHDPLTTRESAPRAEPPGVLRELARVAGRRRTRYGLRIPRTAGELAAYAEASVAGVRQQGRGLAHLVAHTRWDFFFGAFAESHEAGHLLWHLAVPEHPRHDPSAAPVLKDALRAIYRGIDDALAELVARVPDDVAVLVVSAYGMGPHHHLEGVIDPLLERAGWTARAGRDALVAAGPRARALVAARRAVRRLVPAALRPALGRLVPRERLLGEIEHADVDWRRTRLFALPSDGSTFLRVNLRDREPGGIVTPGGDYDALCDEVAGLLRGLRDGATGERLCVRVERTSRLFGAPPVGPMPDLCVQWVRRHQARVVEAPGLGRLDVPGTDPRTAIHWAPGFILARGPGIAPSGARRLEGSSARVVDLAATVLALLGVPQPPALPGRPVPALVSAAP
jgi:predicted AlkP superfamily phosphohydrolase/phosphomutase